MSTESSENASNTPETPTQSNPDNPLELPNGRYLLAEEPAGPGSPEDIVATYGPMPEKGFNELGILVYSDGRTGVMQSTVDSTLHMRVWGADLADAPFDSSNEFARADVQLLDGQGDDVLKEGQVESEFGYLSVAGGDYPWEGDGLNIYVEFLEEGDFTLLMDVTIPGYEPLTIEQPVRVV